MASKQVLRFVKNVRSFNKPATNVFKVPSRQLVGNFPEGQSPYYCSMDDLPKPGGCWDEYYKAKQKKYNMLLLSSVLFAVGTLVTIICGDLVFGNWIHPYYNGEDDDEDDECEE